MRIPRSSIATFALAALLIAPAFAAAQFEALYHEYQSSGGRIDGCAHSADELTGALGEIPADVRAYDPGFADALNLALDQRVGGCGAARQEPAPAKGGGIVVAGDGSPGPASPQRMRLARAGEEPGFPLALVGAMVVAAVLVGLGAGIAAAGYFGSAPRSGSPRAAGRSRRLGERLLDSLWVLRDRLGR
jgi:hypothetical protein